VSALVATIQHRSKARAKIMPRFTQQITLPRPLDAVWDFFLQPANIVRVAPPELHMKLVEGPERLELGSKIILKGRRWGIPQRVVSEVVTFEPKVMFADEQRQGPFKKWRHTHRFETVSEGTRVEDVIDFEPPGGLLGLIVTEAFVRKDLEWIFGYRAEKLRELLGGP
jgi:ligand-binding SRPBCC domain-containing protein